MDPNAEKAPPEGEALSQFRMPPLPLQHHKPEQFHLQPVDTRYKVLRSAQPGMTAEVGCEAMYCGDI